MFNSLRSAFSFSKILGKVAKPDLIDLKVSDGKLESSPEADTSSTVMVSEKKPAVTPPISKEELGSLQSEISAVVGKERSEQDKLDKLIEAEKKASENLKKTLEKLSSIENEYSTFKSKFDQFKDEKNKAIADKQFLEGKRKELESKVDELIKDRSKAIEDKQFVEKQLSKTKDELKQVLTAKEKEYLSNKQLSSKITELQSNLDGQKKLYESLSDENKSLREDSDSMLMHLHQVQEELERYYFSNQAIKLENQVIKSRWERLQKRLPSYFDFKSLEALAYDGVSEPQVISWQVKDYVHSNGSEFLELFFKTEFKNGVPSIILNDPEGSFEDIYLSPKLVFSDQGYASQFRAIGSNQWQRLVAAMNVLEFGLSSGWQETPMPDGCDLSFYANLLAQLISDFKKLPSIMRFDRVKLKRELQNPDYEHLWLEIYGLSYGQLKKPKLEMRLGAQLEKDIEFSRLPKYEFPLIDGKLEPFESWFPESADDFGSKFELRFALEKNVFDFATWSKLSAQDRELTYGLICLAPAMLDQMVARQVPINRDWKYWQDLSSKSALLLAALIQKMRESRPADVIPVSSNNVKNVVKEVTIAPKVKKVISAKKPSRVAK